MTTLTFTDSEFRRIGALMYETVGLSYNDSKKSLILSRLATRIQKLGLWSFDEYIDILEEEFD